MDNMRKINDFDTLCFEILYLLRGYVPDIRISEEYTGGELSMMLKDFVGDLISKFRKFDLNLEEVQEFEIADKIHDHKRKVLEVLSFLEKQLENSTEEVTKLKRQMNELSMELDVAEKTIVHLKAIQAQGSATGNDQEFKENEKTKASYYSMSENEVLQTSARESQRSELTQAFMFMLEMNGKKKMDSRYIIKVVNDWYKYIQSLIYEEKFKIDAILESLQSSTENKEYVSGKCEDLFEEVENMKLQPQASKVPPKWNQVFKVAKNMIKSGFKKKNKASPIKDSNHTICSNDTTKEVVNIVRDNIEITDKQNEIISSMSLFQREYILALEKQIRDLKIELINARCPSKFLDDFDYCSSVELDLTFDPNVGLMKKLEYIDHHYKIEILKDLKSQFTCSEEISTGNWDEINASSTVMLLGGLNPEKPNDYFTGGSMYIYNLKEDKWLFGGTMPEPRNYHGAVYLNGEVYVTGGYSPLDVINDQMIVTQSLFQFTVRSRRWRRMADMQQARACHATCVIEDKLMVLGGRDDTRRLLSTVEMYFPKQDQWSFSKPMPEPIMGMACSVMDECVYIMGGIVCEGLSPSTSVSNRVYMFDIQKQSWDEMPPLPESRAFACAATLKPEIWLWCGMKNSANEDGYRQSTNTLYVFNPETTSWTTRTAIGTEKHGTAITKFGMSVYLLGGMSNVPAGKEVLGENICYCKENERYSEGAPLPYPMTGTAAVTLPIDYNLNYPNENTFNESATKIQALFRGYRTRTNNQFHKIKQHKKPSSTVYYIKVEDSVYEITDEKKQDYTDDDASTIIVIC